MVIDKHHYAQHFTQGSDSGGPDAYTASVLVLQAILQSDSFSSWKCSQGVDTDFRVQTMKLLIIEYNSAYKASGIRAEKSVTLVTQHRKMNKT